MYDIIIIGGGTAGLTAAIYCSRASHSTLLLEGESFGGQIVTSPRVDNYPGLPGISGYDYSLILKKQAQDTGTEVKNERVQAVESSGNGFVCRTRKNTYEAKAVIIAAGAHPRKLGLPREDDLIGSGISFCATCDGAFFKGRDTAVAGGGDTAVQDALYLSALCRTVYIIHRRDEFRASGQDVERLLQTENIKPLLNKTISALNGEFSLESLTLNDKLTGEDSVLPVNGLFEAVGQIPDTEIFSSLVDLDKSGYIQAGEDCRTSREGVFAAGDCRTKAVRQLTTAAADGAAAAAAAIAYCGR